MTTRHLRHGLYFFVFFLASSGAVFPQAPLTVGPLTVTIPRGWTKQEFFGTVKYYSPDSTTQQFLRVQFLPSRVQFLPSEETPQSVAQRHSTIIGNLAGIMKPGTSPQNGVTGNFIWSKVEVQMPPGPPETMIWYSAKAGSTYVAVGLETDHPDMLARNLPAVEAMLAHASERRIRSLEFRISLLEMRRPATHPAERPAQSGSPRSMNMSSQRQRAGQRQALRRDHVLRRHRRQMKSACSTCCRCDPRAPTCSRTPTTPFATYGYVASCSATRQWVRLPGIDHSRLFRRGLGVRHHPARYRSA